jgi:hypothetical protein
MKNMLQHYETTLKNVIALQSHARDVSVTVSSLDEKIKYNKLTSKLSEIHKDLLILRFDIEDANKVNVEKCPRCFNII